MKTREPAWRVMPKELYDARLMYPEGPQEEMTPRYVVTPLGAMVNRVFFVGRLDDVKEHSMSDGGSFYNARIKCASGWSYFIGAGKFQQDIAAFLGNMADNYEKPFVAVVAKAKLQEREDTGEMRVTLRPESIAVTDKNSYNYWLIEAARHTINRIKAYYEMAVMSEPTEAKLIEMGISPPLAKGLILARDHYGVINVNDYAHGIRSILASVAGIEKTDEVEPEEFIQSDEDLAKDTFVPPGGDKVAVSPISAVETKESFGWEEQDVEEEEGEDLLDELELEDTSVGGGDLIGTVKREIVAIITESGSTSITREEIMRRCTALGINGVDVSRVINEMISEGDLIDNDDMLDVTFDW